MKWIYGILMLTITTSAFANGWRCTSKEGGWEVKLYDRVKTPDHKTPAVLVISKDDELVALALGSKIKMETEKSSFPGDTPSKEQKVYSASDFAEIGESMDVKSAVLTVNGNQDSEKLADLQKRAGTLALESGRGQEEPKDLNCKYYLKLKR